ncbi:hypothetical protein [Rhodospirillaceae bacterium SYSU D60014]|uniref:hypothetical protein n=1 Tax=Virgifigura deserti TaxID=2268457 RepID=UPI000E6725F5
MTKTDRVGELLAITSRLIACMEREIELLHAMRPQDIGALQLDKTALADAYEAHLRALNAAAEGDEVVSQALREELIQATERFQNVLTENARALKAVKTAHDRVLRAIVDAVEQKRGRSAGYTATGAATGAPPGSHRSAGAAPPVCMTVNQKL